MGVIKESMENNLDEQKNIRGAKFPKTGMINKQIENLSGVSSMLSDAYNTAGGKRAAAKFNAYSQDLEAASKIEGYIGQIQSQVASIQVTIEAHDDIVS